MSHDNFYYWLGAFNPNFFQTDIIFTVYLQFWTISCNERTSNSRLLSIKSRQLQSIQYRSYSLVHTLDGSTCYICNIESKFSHRIRQNQHILSSNGHRRNFFNKVWHIYHKTELFSNRGVLLIGIELFTGSFWDYNID